MQGRLSAHTVMGKDGKMELLMALDPGNVNLTDVGRIRLVLPTFVLKDDIESNTIDTVEVSESDRITQYQPFCAEN